MKSIRVIGLTVALAAMMALSSPQISAAADNTLHGELVVLNAGARQFRIVGQDGSFTAPAGMSIDALDGHTVEVFVSNGRVEQIVERPVAIQPIPHGFSTVRGNLVVRDPINRTFTMAGDEQIYLAPANTDVALYSGKMVEVRLDENDHVVDVNLVPGQPIAAAPPAATGCMYGGQPFSIGATVCQSGTTHRCDATGWLSTSSPCGGMTSTSMSGSRAADAPPRSPRSCAIGDATVANGSSICRSGTTYRCDDGSWINQAVACR